jgi:hypothetical protein
VLAFLALMLLQNYFLKKRVDELPYSEFKKFVDEKKVEYCVIGQERIKGVLRVSEETGGGSEVKKAPVKDFFTYRVEDPDSQ